MISSFLRRQKVEQQNYNFAPLNSGSKINFLAYQPRWLVDENIYLPDRFFLPAKNNKLHFIIAVCYYYYLTCHLGLI